MMRWTFKQNMGCRAKHIMFFFVTAMVKYAILESNSQPSPVGQEGSWLSRNGGGGGGGKCADR